MKRSCPQKKPAFLKNNNNNKDLKTLVEFFNFLLPFKTLYVYIFLLGIVSICLELAVPFFSKNIVDKAIIPKDVYNFVFFGLLTGGVFVVNGGVKSVLVFMKNRVQAKVAFNLNKKLFEHIVSLPIGFFQDKSTGEQLFKMHYDIEAISSCLVDLPEELFELLPKLIITLGILFYFDWQIAIFSIVVAPTLYFPLYYFMGLRKKLLEQIINTTQHIFKMLGEFFEHIYFIKAVGAEEKESSKYLKRLGFNVKLKIRNLRLEVISNTLAGSINRMAVGAVVLFGGYQVIRGRITPGVLTAIMMYVGLLMCLQGRITGLCQSVVFVMVSCRRVDQVLKTKPFTYNKQTNRKRVELDKVTINFQEVSFGYAEKRLVLDKISFCFQDKFISIAGESGCGKTTLINLLLGLYIPSQGKIEINGIELRDIDVLHLKEQIGIVLQEPFLWNDTVESNIIGYGSTRVTQEDVLMAATLCGVDEFVKGLPAGYKTVIGENACKFSEGQKQKIALARAIAKRPKLLILDEAFSYMDSRSEEKILEATLQQHKEMQLLVISHRYSTVSKADKVCFFEQEGNVVMNSPSIMLKENRLFFDLFASQIKQNF